MPRTRRDVWKLQQPWDDVLLFYARAVGVLKKREAAKRNSWAFFGGMHGFDEPLWQAFGYLSRRPIRRHRRPTGRSSGSSVSTRPGISSRGIAATWRPWKGRFGG